MSYSAAGITALGDTPEIYYLIKLDLDAPQYVTTAPRDIVYDSQTWSSNALLTSIPSLKHSLGMKPNGISIDMDGAALVNQSLTFENTNNAEVLIYRYLADTEEARLEFKGFIQTYSKKENIQKGTSVISWKIASHWHNWEAKYGRVMNDTVQQELHTGDRFFQYAELIDNKITDWAEADQDFGGFIGGLITGVAGAVGNLAVNLIETADDIWSGVFGGGGDDHVTQTKVNVDEHILNTGDPESRVKRLPVMYGEGRVKGKVVFRGLDPADKQFLYIVYALSEGTIDGLTGNKIEFKNGEPYTSSRVSPYCSLIAEYDGSQTSADATLISKFSSTGTGAGYLVNGALSAGATTITADTGTGTILVGDIVVFSGSIYQYRVTTALSAGSFTIEDDGLKEAVSNNATITLVSRWTTNHIGNGVAYAVVRYKKGIVWSGEPVPAFVLKGRHVLDTRTGVTGYSDNPALIAYDYATDTLFGKGIDSSDIDIVSISAGATLCETTNTDHDGSGTTTKATTPASIDLFSFNGALNTNQPVKENMKKILYNMRAHFPFVYGKYKLVIEQTSETSVYSFDEDNIAGDFSVSETAASTQYNEVYYEVIAPDFDYKKYSCVVSSSAYLTADNGVKQYVVIENPYERNRYRGINRASTIMKKSREGIRVKLNASNADALQIEVGQLVDITRTSEGWSGKLFRVTAMTTDAAGNVSCSLEEYESSVYDWSVSVEAALPEDTTLPDNTTVLPPTGLTLASGSSNQVEADDGTRYNRIKVSFTAPTNDPYVEGYNIRYKVTGDTDYVYLKPFPSSVSASYIDNVLTGIDYTVEIQSYNAQGTESAWVTDTHTVTGTWQIGGDTLLLAANSYNGASIFYKNDFQNTTDLTVSAAASLASNGLELPANGLGVSAYMQVPYYNTDRKTWDKNRRFKAYITIENLNLIGSGGTNYMKVGIGSSSYATGSTRNSLFFEITYNSGTTDWEIQGYSAGNPYSLYTTSKATISKVNPIIVEAVIYSGTKAEFFVDDVSIGSTTTAAQIPSGSTGSPDADIYMGALNNGVSAATCKLILNEFYFVQEQ